MQMWNLNVQRQVAGHTLVQVGYVGNNGHHLASNVQLNQVPAELLGPGNAQSNRPYPNVGSIRDGAACTPIGNSTYEALQIQMKHRFQHGFSAQVAYTFSKSIDEFQGNLSFGIVHLPRHRHAELLQHRAPRNRSRSSISPTS